VLPSGSVSTKVAWAVATVVAVASYAGLSGLEPIDRTVWSFVVAEAAAQLAMLVLLPRERAARAASDLSPGA